MVVLATLYIRSKPRHKMYIVRTYFLFRIVNGKEIRYSVYTSVTSCLEMFATSLARPAHSASESYETRSKADVDRASGCSGYMGHPFAQSLIGTFTPFTLIPEKPCSNRGKISPIHNREEAPRGGCHLCSAICSFVRRWPGGNCFKVFQNNRERTR